MSVDELFNSRRDKITRRRADQLRSPLRAAPVFGAPMFARRALDHPVRQRHPGSHRQEQRRRLIAWQHEPMLWSEQWRALGLQAPIQLQAEPS